MQTESGQSLIEVIVASTVGILVVTALTFATIFSLRNATFAKTSAQATKLAQEGIEWVRTGRDRDSAITGSFQIGGNNITSWNGGNVSTQALWTYQINGNCGNTTVAPPTYCYFNINSSGVLQYLAAASSVPSSAEVPSGSPGFQRVVILSDESSSFTNQKTVTVVVQWSDTAGKHESRLTTILRKL